MEVIKKFELEDSTDIYNAMCAVYKLQNWHALKNEKKTENHVWDEDKTVRENRQITAQHNANIETEIKRRQEVYAESMRNLETAIINYIMEYFEYEDVKCSSEHAEKIWTFCKQQWEDDPHNYISDVCQFYINIMS